MNAWLPFIGTIIVQLALGAFVYGKLTAIVSEQGKRLDEHSKSLDAHDARIYAHESRLARLEK